MKSATILSMICLLSGVGFLACQTKPVNSQKGKTTMTIYDFTMKNIDGLDTPLSEYRGKLILIVNTASRCGFTPQYDGLQQIYEKYREQGFVILGFPANNFLRQEPGTNEEIKAFCTTRHHVTCPMFAKISVKGKDQHPLYHYLTDSATNPQFAGAIAWNFNKFLVDRQGQIINRFGSRVKPEDEKLIQAIEGAL